MNDAIRRFRDHVIDVAGNPHFVHHRWYVEYHLVIVERLALELCARYPVADRDLVLVLVWLHDYGKLIDAANEHATSLTEGRAAMLASGLSPELVDRALAAYKTFERPTELATASLEVQIVASADGASHLVGPFYSLWWYEHPERPIAQLLEDNRQKALFDWTYKIVLPEVRAAFATRHHLRLEASCQLPQALLETS